MIIVVECASLLSNDVILRQCSASLAFVAVIFIAFVIAADLPFSASLIVVYRLVVPYIDISNTAVSLTLIVLQSQVF